MASLGVARHGIYAIIICEAGDLAWRGGYGEARSGEVGMARQGLGFN